MEDYDKDVAKVISQSAHDPTKTQQQTNEVVVDARDKGLITEKSAEAYMNEVSYLKQKHGQIGKGKTKHEPLKK